MTGGHTHCYREQLRWSLCSYCASLDCGVTLSLWLHPSARPSIVPQLLEENHSEEKNRMASIFSFVILLNFLKKPLKLRWERQNQQPGLNTEWRGVGQEACGVFFHTQLWPRLAPFFLCQINWAAFFPGRAGIEEGSGSSLPILYITSISEYCLEFESSCHKKIWA